VRARVDPTKCQGYAICAELAPGRFTLDDWGYAQAVAADVPDAEADAVEEAVRECPVKAIRWTTPPITDR
jgi:ferredoxin